VGKAGGREASGGVPTIHPASGTKMVGTALRAFAHPTKLDSSKKKWRREIIAAPSLLAWKIR
jgi:hypothetical protein